MIKALLSIFFELSLIMFLLLLLRRDDKNDGEKELFKKQKWKISDVVITILSFYIIKTIFTVMLHSLHKFDLHIYALANKMSIFIAPVIFFLVVVGLFKFKFRQDVRILGFKKSNLKKDIGLGISVALVSYLIMLLLQQNTKDIFKVIKNFDNPLYYPLFVFLVVILSPIIEETVYRGILYSPYRKKYGATWAVIISSLIFSLSHFALLTIIFSIFLSILYEKTESIVAPIVAHSAYNSLAVATAFYLLR